MYFWIHVYISRGTFCWRLHQLYNWNISGHIEKWSNALLELSGSLGRLSREKSRKRRGKRLIIEASSRRRALRHREKRLQTLARRGLREDEICFVSYPSVPFEAQHLVTSGAETSPFAAGRRVARRRNAAMTPLSAHKGHTVTKRGTRILSR